MSSSTKEAPVAEPEVEVPAEVSEIDTLLKSTVEQYQAKLEELRPAHEAFLKMQAVVNNFTGVANGTIRASGGAARADRGSRPAEFLNTIQASGDEGITVTEAAEKMGAMNPNYLYRLAKELTESGQIRKDGKRYFAAS